VYSSGGNTTISGSISTTAGGGSLRAQAAPISAIITFYYLDNTGDLVPIPIVTGNNVTFSAGTAEYTFSVTLPTAAQQRRNFILQAVTNTNETIEGVVPFDPTTEISVSVPPIDPDDAGPAAFVKLCANPTYGIPNVDIANVLTIYTPAQIKEMVNADGTPKADLTNLATQFKARDAAIQTAIGQFSTYTAKIQQLMDYSFQLARNPDYIGFANREKFVEAMKAKATELGLPLDAFNALDKATTDIWDKLPMDDMPDNVKNYGGAQEQNREMENISLSLQYFAGLFTGEAAQINQIRETFLTKAAAFFDLVLAGPPPAMTAPEHPFVTLDLARTIIFNKLGNVVKEKILVSNEDMQEFIGPPPVPQPGVPPVQPSFEDMIAHKTAIYEEVVKRINENYPNLTGAPTDATEKAKFIQALATLASIPMAPQQQ